MGRRPETSSSQSNQGMTEAPTERRRTWLAAVMIACVVGLALLRSIQGTSLDGLTPDEPYHMVAGVSYVVEGDFRLNPEHPPLAKLPVGWALAGSLETRPLTLLADKYEERNMTEEVVFLENDPALQQHRARAAMYAFHALLLALFLALAVRVFGLAWATVTGIWLALEPTVLAHMPVVMTDLPLTLTQGLALLTCGLAFSTWTRRWAVAAGLGCGLALAAKHSALPGLAGIGLLGLALALAPTARHDWITVRRRVARLLIVACVALGVLWAHYGFRFHASPDGGDPFNRSVEAKIADLAQPGWRWLVGTADRLHVAPRAYLWGLADTVRAGVEGRSQDEHHLFSMTYTGSPPWFFWLGIVAAKVPLPHLLLALCGLVALGLAALGLITLGPGGRSTRDLPLTSATVALWALGALSCAHFLALMTSRGTYGGVRHALPLVLALGVVAGATTRLGTFGRSARGRALWSAAPAAVLLLASFLLTVREPRLWEYFNELAGGTSNGANMFSDEGVYLGQRLPEIAAYWHGTLGSPDEPLYPMVWVVEEEAKGLELPLRRRAESIHDDNHEGIFHGYFLVDAGSFRPRPNWDPTLLDDLETVHRFGNVYLMHGRIAAPRFRAWDMLDLVNDTLAATPEGTMPEWPTLIQRLEEIGEALPWASTPHLLRGNGYLALGERDAALDAYRTSLEKTDPSDPARLQLEEQIERLASGAHLAGIGPLRNPALE